MSHVFSSPKNDPTYRSALNEAGVYGLTEMTAIYDGSRWVAEIGKTRDGRYAFVSRMRHPKTGALQPFVGDREAVQRIVYNVTGGDLCAAPMARQYDAAVARLEALAPKAEPCSFITGSEFYPDENVHMPVTCDKPSVADGMCEEHYAAMTARTGA